MTIPIDPDFEPPAAPAIDDEGIEYICHHAREFLERS